jgi:hypothetical protein
MSSELVFSQETQKSIVLDLVSSFLENPPLDGVYLWLLWESSYQ